MWNGYWYWGRPTNEELRRSFRELTRLATVQNETVFEPHLQAVDTQIEQLDAILAEVDRNQQQVADVLYWVSQFAVKIPSAIPEDFGPDIQLRP